MRSKTLLAAASALALAAVAATAEPVKVGMITTLSGGGASLGIDTRDGFLLALKDAPDAVDLIVEDDEQAPDKAVQIADRMIQSDKVEVLTGIVWSNLAMAVVPSATGQGLVYLSTNAAPSQLAGPGCSPDYFSVSYQNDNLHEAAGEYANTAGMEKMFILAPNYPAGKDSLAGFKRFYKGEITDEVYTKLGATDYAAEIAQIKASDADGVFFFLPGGMGISFMKQYAGSGAEKPLVGPAFSFDQNILQAVGDAALGVKNTSTWSPDLDNEANAAFVTDYEAEYGRLPSIYAAQGYDTAHLLLAALETAAPSDREAFRDALEAADFASVRGDFAFGPNHHPIQDIYVREVVKDGEIYTNRITGVAIEDRADAYAEQCKM